MRNKRCLFELNISYQGEDIPVYITPDAKYFLQGIVEIETNNSAIPEGSVIPEGSLSDEPVFLEGYLMECEPGINNSCFIETNLSEYSVSKLGYIFAVVDFSGKAAIGEPYMLEVINCFPDWILEDAWGECTGSDVQFKDWIDLNQCGTDYEKPDKLTQSCDFCVPNWSGILDCQKDDSLFTSYYDSNNCYFLTNLTFDLEGEPNETIEEYACDYDDNGIIGDAFDNEIELLIGDSSNISEEFTGTKLIELKKDNKTILEFNFTFTYSVNSSITSSSTYAEEPKNATPAPDGGGGGGGGGVIIRKNKLNLQKLNITLNSNESDSSYLLVQGIDLSSQNNTKTIYLDKIINGTGLCIKDEEISSISEMSGICNGVNETGIFCPGTSGDYSCELIENETRYKISGLSHSGVKEQLTFCGDNVCNGGETCSDCSKDCGACPAPVSDGGGGGGGGGGSYSSASTKENNTENKTESEKPDVIPEINDMDEKITGINETINDVNKSGFSITGAFGSVVSKFRENNLYVFYGIILVIVVILGIKLCPGFVRKLKSKRILNKSS